MDAKIKKKSQVTVFIIIALMIVLAILLLFFVNYLPKMERADDSNPQYTQATIESCTRQATEEAIRLLSIHGGDITAEGSVTYEDEQIAYLCYNSNFYETCVNQKPLLIEHIEKEITTFVTPRIDKCFSELEYKLRNDGRYDIEDSGKMYVKTSLFPKQVIVEIERKVTFAKGEEVRKFDDFKMIMIHPIYNLAKIASEIVNQNTAFCHFDLLGFMIMNPAYDITETITGNADKIYVVKERQTGQGFNFAIKTCPLPPGY